MENRITIKDLKKHLELFPDDAELDFSELTFYKTKSRSADNKLIQIEFEEVKQYDKDGNIIFLKSRNK